MGKNVFQHEPPSQQRVTQWIPVLWKVTSSCAVALRGPTGQANTEGTTLSSTKTENIQIVVAAVNCFQWSNKCQATTRCKNTPICVNTRPGQLGGGSRLRERPMAEDPHKEAAGRGRCGPWAPPQPILRLNPSWLSDANTVTGFQSHLHAVGGQRGQPRGRPTRHAACIGGPDFLELKLAPLTEMTSPSTLHFSRI